MSTPSGLIITAPRQTLKLVVAVVAHLLLTVVTYGTGDAFTLGATKGRN